MTKRVTGIGGIFFKAKDPDSLRAWYHEHLGLEPDPHGGVTFEWREKEEPEKIGRTVWSLFPEAAKYLQFGLRRTDTAFLKFIKFLLTALPTGQ